METIRIFGGKPSAEDQAVDVQSIPTEELAGIGARVDQKRLAFWGFLFALVVVIGASAYYMTTRTLAHADSHPVPRPPAPKAPGAPPAPGQEVAAKPVESSATPEQVEAPASVPGQELVKTGELVKDGEPVKDGVIRSASDAKPLEKPVVPDSPPGPALRVSTASTPIAPAQPVAAPPSQDLLDVGRPEIGKWYLQLGSLEKGVAEVIVQGLRARGLHSVWGPGVNERLGRVLVGPYDSIEDTERVRKQVEDLGFSKPFPKRIGPEDVRGLSPAQNVSGQAVSGQTVSGQPGQAQPGHAQGTRYNSLAALPEK